MNSSRNVKYMIKFLKLKLKQIWLFKVKTALIYCQVFNQYRNLIFVCVYQIINSTGYI